MSQFSELKITKKGQALIAKIMAGEVSAESVKFTKIAASSHDYQLNELENLTELLDIQQSNTDPKTTRLNEVAVKVETAFSNTELTVGYNIKVLGLFAQDSDESEILYAAAKEISGNCYMPPYNGVTVSGAYIQLLTTVGNADSVNFEVNPGAVATIGDIQELQKQIDEIEAFIGMGGNAGHPGKSVIGEEGVHDLRYYNKQLQVKEGGTWVTANAGGSGGGVGPQLVITVETGSTVKVSDGVNELSGIAEDNSIIFNLPNFGQWTITAEKNEKTATLTLTIDTAKQYTASITYFSATLTVTAEQGAEIKVTDGTHDYTATAEGGATATFKIQDAGTYAVTAQKNGATSSMASVEIEQDGGTYTATVTFIVLTVKAKEGSTITVQSGASKLTDTTTGTSIFYLPQTGVWNVTAQLGKDSGKKSVVVDSYKAYSVEIAYFKIMTAIIDLSDSNPDNCVTYADDAGSMTPKSADWDTFFGHYPCLLKNGEEQGKLNPADFAQLAEGGAADITTGGAGDVMICFPRRGLKLTTAGNKITISMTDNPNDPEFKYYAHMAGSDELEAFYVGAFKGYEDTDGKLRSLSGKAPTVSKTIGAFRTAAQKNGDGYQQSAFYQLLFRQCAFILKYKTLNGQTAIGRGFVDGNSGLTNTGGTIARGMDYGESGGKQQMKLFGIEDFWGNIWEWIDGLVSDASRNMLINTANFQDDGMGEGYKSYPSGLGSNTGGYMKTPQGTTETGFVIKETGGSETTYFCDYADLDASGVAYFGGSWSDASAAGAFHLHVHTSASISSGNLGARLAYFKKKAA